MKLSVIIPVFNEYETIERVIDKVLKVDLGDIKKEIIIIDDGSNDQTTDVLKKKIEPLVSKIIYKEKKREVFLLL